MLDRQSDGVDLLDEPCAERRRERPGTRAGDRGCGPPTAAHRRGRTSQRGAARGTSRAAWSRVAGSRASGRRACRIEGDRFDGGRADVEPNDDLRCHWVPPGEGDACVAPTRRDDEPVSGASNRRHTAFKADNRDHKMRAGDACVAATRRNDEPMSGASDRRHTAFKADNVGSENGLLPTAGSEKTWVR